jgi:hypothetical protein
VLCARSGQRGHVLRVVPFKARCAQRDRVLGVVPTEGWSCWRDCVLVWYDPAAGSPSDGDRVAEHAVPADRFAREIVRFLTHFLQRSHGS